MRRFRVRMRGRVMSDKQLPAAPVRFRWHRYRRPTGGGPAHRWERFDEEGNMTATQAYKQISEPAGEMSDQLLLEQLPQVKYIARRIHCLLYTSPSPRDGL